MEGPRKRKLQCSREFISFNRLLKDVQLAPEHQRGLGRVKIDCEIDRPESGRRDEGNWGEELDSLSSWGISF